MGYPAPFFGGVGTTRGDGGEGTDRPPDRRTPNGVYGVPSYPTPSCGTHVGSQVVGEWVSDPMRTDLIDGTASYTFDRTDA